MNECTYRRIMNKHKNFAENIFRMDDNLVPIPSMFHESIVEQYWIRRFNGNIKKLTLVIKSFKERPQYCYFPNIVNIIQQEEYEEHLEYLIGYL